MDTQALFKITYGLYLISSKYQDKESGCIVNTLTQVTADPVQICLTVQKKSYTAQIIEQGHIFNATVLLEGISMDIIKTFGFESGRNKDKFHDIEYQKDEQGIKYIAKKMAAYFSCEVIKTLDVGTHYMFIAKVKEARILSEQPVLTYEAYQTKKKELDQSKTKGKQGWRCVVCGYIYEGETLPKDYICPLCKVDASHFEKI